MGDEIEQMELAIATLWEAFVDSPLAMPLHLASVGFDKYSGGAGFNGLIGWDVVGDFYGNSSIWLTRRDGIQFLWNVGVLYEQGMHDGKFWEHEAVYAYVGVTPSKEEGVVHLYSIGDVGLQDGVELRKEPLALRDLPCFSKEIERLSRICFEDLDYVYQHNLFNDLFDLGLQRMNGQDGWASNPLRSTHHD